MKQAAGPLHRLALFGVVLFGAFGSAYAVGERLPGHDHGATESHQMPGSEAAPHTHDATEQPAATRSDGYELRLDQATTDGHTLRFRIVGPDGATVTDFLDNHGSKLHTVLIRRDLSGFQHVHPDLGADGAWTVTVPTGAWHLVFDVWPQGATRSIVLATNADDEVVVPSVELPAADDAPRVGGLTVHRSGLTFTVTDSAGEAATGLEPYLGAAGHLIAIRQGDLAYTHLHPSAAPATAMPGMTMPTVAAGGDATSNVLTFSGALTTGTYRVFLQFGHDGTVVTVPYTVVIP